jgi:hypothetical protein
MGISLRNIELAIADNFWEELYGDDENENWLYATGRRVS